MSNNRLRRNRINEISHQIEALSRELNQLLQLENKVEATQRPPSGVLVQAVPAQVVELVQDPQVGQEVEIINNYRNLQGARGIVIRITRRQVTIRLHERGRIVTRNKSNVRIVESN